MLHSAPKSTKDCKNGWGYYSTTVLTFLLSGLQSAIQSELDSFFAALANRADSVREVSAQTFCQARVKISALAFAPINTRLIALVEKHWAVPRWCGLRGVAGDGSKVRLTLMNKGVRSLAEGVAFGLTLSGDRVVSGLRFA